MLSDLYATWSICCLIYTLPNPFAIWSIGYLIHTLFDPYVIQSIRYLIHTLSDPYVIWFILYPIHTVVLRLRSPLTSWFLKNHAVPFKNLFYGTLCLVLNISLEFFPKVTCGFLAAETKKETVRNKQHYNDNWGTVRERGAKLQQ